MNKKALIFMGDSWTRGWTIKDEAGLPEHERIAHKDKWNNEPVYSDNEYCAGFPTMIGETYKNIDVFNASRSGSANMTMYNELAKRSLSFEHYDDVIVVHSITSPERFTFLRYDEKYRDICVDDFRVNMIHTNETQEMGPTYHGLFKAYIAHVYNDAARLAYDSTLAIMSLQNLCKVRGFKYIFANAFYIDEKRITEEDHFAPQIDWSNYLNYHRDYASFAEMLMRIDPEVGHDEIKHFQEKQFIGKNTKYFSDCFHPNLAGHDLIGKEYVDFINKLYPGFLE